MEHDDLCSILVETYYDAIYRYCYATLQFDEQAAQDCTQETFYLLVKKKAVLNLHGNMKVWLYKTADRVMRNYMRREYPDRSLWRTRQLYLYIPQNEWV